MPGSLPVRLLLRVRRTVLPVSVFPFIFINAVGHIRADKSRCYGVHRHVFSGHFLCQCFGGGYHSAFGCRIVGLSRYSFDTRQGNDVDDTSESLYQHIFSKGWVTLKKPFRLISNTRLHSSCSIHSIRLSRRIPALFTSTSM